MHRLLIHPLRLGGVGGVVTSAVEFKTKRPSRLLLMNIRDESTSSIEKGAYRCFKYVSLGAINK